MWKKTVKDKQFGNMIKNLYEQCESFDELIAEHDGIEVVDKLYQRHCGKEDTIVSWLLESSLFKRKKSIINTIAIYYPRIRNGGVERVISLLVPIYIKMGYQVILLTEETPTPQDYEIPQGVKRYVLPKAKDISNEGHYNERGQRLMDVLTQEKVDALCHLNTLSDMAIWDLLTAKLCGVNCIFCKHDFFSKRMLCGNRGMWREGSIARLADDVIVLSRTEELYYRTIGVDAHYIPNPIYNMKDSRLERNEKYIVWVGRLDRVQKQYWDVIPIMECVLKEEPEAKMKFFGMAETKADEMQFRKEICRHGLQKSVEYCSGVTALDELYGEAMIHLVTSSFESFSMTIVESRSYGVPLVTYDMPYLEVLKDGKGYIAVRQGDYMGAASAIIELLRDPELRKQMSCEAGDVLSQFDNEILAEKWRRVFEDAYEDDAKEENIESLKKEYAVLLQTMLFHYEMGNYETEKKAIQKVDWKVKLLCRLRKDNFPVAIYPYGTVGQRVKEFLDELETDGTIIIDNTIGQQDKNILTLKDLETLDCKRWLFVICSNRAAIYDEVREALYQYVDKENVLDLFPMD